MACRRNLSLVVALVLCFAALMAIAAFDMPAEAQATTRYVATSGVDGGDCTHPDQPCRTVQFAVDVSASNDVIKVATGVYTDVHGFPPAPEDPYPPPGGIVHQVVYIDHTVTIQGGYQLPGFGPPDPAANPTTLEAGELGRVFYLVGEISPILEGLVITEGKVGDPAVEPGYGGGLYIISATVTISDCAIHGNEAVPLYEEQDGNLQPVAGSQGGALYAHGAQVSILHSSVVGNRAWYGAGLCLHGGKLTLLDGDVLGNTATYDSYALGVSGYGGGLYLDGTEASLVGDTVTGNQATGIGGGLCLVGSSATLERVTIGGNRAVGWWAGYGYGSGGGLCARASQVTLIGNTVTGNHAYWYGGGLDLGDSEVIIDQTQVTHNSVVGGRLGLWGGGAGLYLVDSHLTLSRDVVQGNYSEGTPCGALCLSHSRLCAENAFITDNTTAWDSSEQGGGAVDLGGSAATLVHVTLARNTGSRGGGLHVDAGSTVSMTNAILVSHTLGIGVAAGGMAKLEATAWGAGPWANGADWGGDGTIVTGTINLWGDPAFVDPAAGNYHIGAASIALNHGIPAGVSNDIDGEPRPDWCFYDIGADELSTGGRCHEVYLPIVLRSTP